MHLTVERRQLVHFLLNHYLDQIIHTHTNIYICIKFNFLKQLRYEIEIKRQEAIVTNLANRLFTCNMYMIFIFLIHRNIARIIYYHLHLRFVSIKYPVI